MGAPTFSDINKPIKTALSTGYGSSSHSVEIKTPNQSGFLTAKLERKHGDAAPKATFSIEKVHVKSGAIITSSVGTDNVAKFGVKKPELVPGLTYGVEGQCSIAKCDDEKVTSTVEYVKRDLGLSLVSELTCQRGAAAGKASFIFGRGPVVLGAEAAVDAKALALTNYDLGLAYDLPNVVLTSHLLNSGKTASVGIVQAVNKDLAVAVEGLYGLTDKSVRAKVGVQFESDRLTTVRGKVEHSAFETRAHVGIVRKLAAGVKATFGADVNVKDVKDYHFGVGVVFDDRI